MGTKIRLRGDTGTKNTHRISLLIKNKKGKCFVKICNALETSNCEINLSSECTLHCTKNVILKTLTRSCD